MTTSSQIKPIVESSCSELHVLRSDSVSGLYSGCVALSSRRESKQEIANIDVSLRSIVEEAVDSAAENGSPVFERRDWSKRTLYFWIDFHRVWSNADDEQHVRTGFSALVSNLLASKASTEVFTCDFCTISAVVGGPLPHALMLLSDFRSGTLEWPSKFLEQHATVVVREKSPKQDKGSLGPHSEAQVSDLTEASFGPRERWLNSLRQLLTETTSQHEDSAVQRVLEAFSEALHVAIDTDGEKKPAANRRAAMKAYEGLKRIGLSLAPLLHMESTQTGSRNVSRGNRLAASDAANSAQSISSNEALRLVERFAKVQHDKVLGTPEQLQAMLNDCAGCVFPDIGSMRKFAEAIRTICKSYVPVETLAFVPHKESPARFGQLSVMMHRGEPRFRLNFADTGSSTAGTKFVLPRLELRPSMQHRKK